MRAPAKTFDIGFDQILIAAQREPAISFSPSYYDVRQAVIALDLRQLFLVTSRRFILRPRRPCTPPVTR